MPTLSNLEFITVLSTEVAGRNVARDRSILINLTFVDSYIEKVSLNYCRASGVNNRTKYDWILDRKHDFI